MNQLGFTHMTLIVDDIEAAIARVVEFGGQVHAETRIDSPYGPIVFCTDPDGVRVELMQPPA
jgi:predicted enzyme related to lactoylglutathione lyase